MTRVWDAFLELGLWTAVLVPGFLFLVALVAGLGLRVAPGVTRVAMAGLAFVSLTLALAMTMRPAAETGTRPSPRWNPWPTIQLVLDGSHTARVQALGNLLLLIPLGCALAFLARPPIAAILVLVVALSLEATQWLLATGRTAETADAALNTTGGLLGVGISMLAIRLAGPPPQPPPTMATSAAPRGADTQGRVR